MPARPDDAPSDRTRVRRHADRAHYDRAAIDAILDDALVAHVAIDTADGPSIIPTAFWRTDDRLFFHGSAANRTLDALRAGRPCCLCVTILDGIVFARSAYHTSMNYRSVVVYGAATEITDEPAKAAALRGLSDKLAPGRWDEMRPIKSTELKATAVFSLPLDEASAKIRDGGPLDEEDDYDAPIWAGVAPLALAMGDPFPDDRYQGDPVPPENVYHLVNGPAAGFD